MRHSQSRAWWIAICLLSLSGCAFEDGGPWGIAEFDLEVSHDGDVALVEFATVELELRSDAAQPADDHGHDHGEAVPVEEDSWVAVAFAHEGISPTPDGVEVELEDCTDECRLPRGELAQVRVVIEAVTLPGGEPVEVDAVLSAPLDGTIGGEEPGGVRLTLRYELPALTGGAVAMREALEAAPLLVELERVDVEDVEHEAHTHE